MVDRIDDLETALGEYNKLVELTSIAISSEADMRKNLPERRLGVRRHGTVSRVAAGLENWAKFEVEEKEGNLSRLADLLEE